MKCKKIKINVTIIKDKIMKFLFSKKIILINWLFLKYLLNKF